MMGWGGVSANHQTDLDTLEGAVAGLQYQDEEPHCTIWASACPHDARVVESELCVRNLNSLPWPAASPELSPI